MSLTGGPLLAETRGGQNPPQAFSANLRKKRVIFLLVALPLFFSTARYIPGFRWSLELGILLAATAALFGGSGLPSRYSSSLAPYILLTAFSLPMLGALAAYVTFDQPILYGLAAQRGCLLALFAYAIGVMIANGRISLSELESAFVILAWINLAVCAPVLIFLDPNMYSDLGSLVSDGGGVYNQFNLPMTFIIFGALYYVSAWILSERGRYALLSAPFVFYILAGNTGRIVNLALAISLFLIAWFGSPRKRLKNMGAALSFALIFLAAVSVAAPDQVDTMIAKYDDAFAAVSGADNVADISANARILQAEVALPYIQQSPIFGSGMLSNEWAGGYEAVFGYFHPSDLGFIGLLFVYGLIGLAFFLVQYVVFLWLFTKVARSVSGVRHQIFFLAIFANLTFLMLSSFVTGAFILVPEQSLFFFSVLFAQLWLNKPVIGPG